MMGRRRPRWAAGAVLALVLGGGVIAGWFLNDRGDLLSSARSRIRTQAVSIDTLTERLTGMQHRLTTAEQEFRTVQQRRREERLERVRAQPCSRRHSGHVWLFPKSGPVGTRVRFAGDCFVNDPAGAERGSGYGMFLTRQLNDPGECEQIVGLDPVDVDLHDGRIEGHFTVGAEGTCFQGGGERRSVEPGTYRLAVACHACLTNARFRVTP